MRKAARFQEDEIRRRVRWHLLREAAESSDAEDLESRRQKALTMQGKYAGSARFRGLMNSEGLPKNESAAGAMQRFKDTLKGAKIGDVFYLTYGVASYRAVSSGGETRVVYTDQLIKDVRSVLFGKYVVSDDDLKKMEEDEREREKTLRESSSSIAQAHRLVSLGMSRIREIQTRRINELEAILRELEEDPTGKDPNKMRSNSVSKLAGILRLNSADVNALKEREEVDPEDEVDPEAREARAAARAATAQRRDSTIKALQQALYTGRIGLTKEYDKSERILIGAAQLVAHGMNMSEVSADLTDIPGKRRVSRSGVASEVAKRVGRSEDVLTAMTGDKVRVEKVGNKEKKVIDPADEKAKETIALENRRRVIDSLVGGCVSSLTFPSMPISITSAEKHLLLEQSGLPLSVLMTIIELLIADIAYGASFRGPKGFLRKLSSNVPNYAAHSYSFIAWGSHLDPRHTLSIARGFIGTGPIAYGKADEFDESGTLVSRALRPGDRLKSYREPGSDAIIRKITTSARAMVVIDDFERDVVDKIDRGVPLEKASPEVVSAVAGAIGEEPTPKLGSVIMGMVLTRVNKHEATGRSRKEYKRKESGRASAAEFAEGVARLSLGETSERMIYERLLRRLLYGVTLVCVGKKAEPAITNDALKSGILSSRESPVFAAKLEVPKQTRKTVIEDLGELKSMITSTATLSPVTKQKGDRPETGMITTPGEATAYGRSSVPRAEIHTPNIQLKITDSQLLGAIENGTVDDMLSDHRTYKLSNPIRIPYIEKKTSERVMDVEDVLALESYYDSALKVRKVAVQLLGAKMIHDPTIAKKAEVTSANIVTIPEMGILPTGAIAESSERPSKETQATLRKQMGSRAAAEISRMSVGGVNGVAESLETFDLTDREVEVGWDPTSLNASVQRAIKDLKEKSLLLGSSKRAISSDSLARKLTRDLRRSHSTDEQSLETAINGRMAIERIDAILEEAKRIAEGAELPNIPSDLLTGIELDSTMMRYVDPSVIATMSAIKRGLSGEISGKMEQRPAFSYIATAGFLGTSNSPDSRSIPDRIRGLKRDRQHDPARINRDGSITVAPLDILVRYSRESASELLKQLKELGVEDAIRRVCGDAVSRDDDEDAADSDPTGFASAHDDLVEKTERLDAALRESVGSKADDILADILAFKDRVVKSQFGAMMRKIDGHEEDWMTFARFLQLAAPALEADISTSEADESAIDGAPKKMQKVLQASDFLDLTRELREIAGLGARPLARLSLSPQSESVIRQQHLASALMDQAQSLVDTARLLIAIVQDSESDGQRLGDIKTNLDNSREEVLALMGEAQSYLIELSDALETKNELDRFTRLAQLLTFDIGSVAERAVEIADSLLSVYDPVTETWQRENTPTPSPQPGSRTFIDVRSRKAGDRVRASAFGAFRVSPGAFVNRYQSASEKSAISPDQFAVMRGVLGGRAAQSLDRGIDPYSIAARLITTQPEEGQRDSQTVRDIKDMALGAFFPGVTPGMRSDLTSGGPSVAATLEVLGGEDGLRTRVEMIIHAAKVAKNRSDAIKRAATSAAGISGISHLLGQVGSIHAYMQATPGMSNLLIEPRVPSPEEPPRVPTARIIQDLVRKPKPRPEEMAASAQGEEEGGGPLISRPGTGGSQFEAGNMASYPDAATRLDDLLREHTDITGPSGPLGRMTISDALDALRSGGLKKGGTVLDERQSPTLAPLIGRLASSLEDARDALAGLFDARRSRAERLGEEPEELGDPGDTQVRRAAKIIAELMPK